MGELRRLVGWGTWLILLAVWNGMGLYLISSYWPRVLDLPYGAFNVYFFVLTAFHILLAVTTLFLYVFSLLTFPLKSYRLWLVTLLMISFLEIIHSLTFLMFCIDIVWGLMVGAILTLNSLTPKADDIATGLIYFITPVILLFYAFAIFCYYEDLRRNIYDKRPPENEANTDESAFPPGPDLPPLAPSLAFYALSAKRRRPLPPELAGETCAICLDPFSGNEEVVTGGCYHLFHWTCLRNWTFQGTTCPVCRRSLLVLDGNSRRERV